MKQMLRTTILVLIVVMIIGCDGRLFPSGSNAFIEYRRTGGFVGFDDHLVIQEDGEVELKRKGQTTQFTLDSETINELVAAFDTAEFSHLNSKYPPAQKGADYIEYEITYQGHTVQAADTGVPEALNPVLDLLNDIVNSGGA